MTSPSGQQFEINRGEQRAEITEVGAGLRTYAVHGVDVVDGYAADEMCSAGRGQQLIPWPNRIEDGCYEFDGRRHQLPLNEPARRNAIHGLVRWDGWSVARHEPDALQLRYHLYPRPGYPFMLDLALEYRLAENGLSVTTSATNIGRDRCPFGIGAHPYATIGSPLIDTAILHVPANSVLDADERGIPRDTRPVAGTAFDFCQPAPIGSTKLDHAFGDLQRDDRGVARIRLSHPESGVTATVWMDTSFRYAMVFSGDTLPEGARRSLAIEPMTCPPNAFRTGQDVIVLEPRQSFSSVWGITPGFTR